MFIVSRPDGVVVSTDSVKLLSPAPASTFRKMRRRSLKLRDSRSSFQTTSTSPVRRCFKQACSWGRLDRFYFAHATPRIVELPPTGQLSNQLLVVRYPDHSPFDQLPDNVPPFRCKVLYWCRLVKPTAGRAGRAHEQPKAGMATLERIRISSPTVFASSIRSAAGSGVGRVDLRCKLHYRCFVRTRNRWRASAPRLKAKSSVRESWAIPETGHGSKKLLLELGACRTQIHDAGTQEVIQSPKRGGGEHRCWSSPREVGGGYGGEVSGRVSLKNLLLPRVEPDAQVAIGKE